MSRKGAQIPYEEDWGKWIIDKEVMSIVVQFGSHKSSYIGNALLDGTREVENIRSGLKNRGSTVYENDQARLEQILLNWEDEKRFHEVSSKDSIEELLQICESQSIGGRLKLELPELDKKDGDRSEKYLRRMMDVVAKYGASKYTFFGTALLEKTIDEVQVMLGVSQVDNKLLMREILEVWLNKKGRQATVQKLLDVCKGAYLGGTIKDKLEELAKKRMSIR
eukprot:m.310849 g.310849  ORF g.310849 m.310849 type:complete len:222 (+) comp55523_c0_seq1:34-699(+)